MWPIVALCAVAFPAPSQAAVNQDTFLLHSTADLIDLCTAAPTDPMGTAALNFCHGFGVGVYRVLDEIQHARKTRMFCMPEPMPSRNEALAGLIQWARANPDQLSTTPQDGVAAYLMKQYPCGKKQ